MEDIKNLNFFTPEILLAYNYTKTKWNMDVEISLKNYYKLLVDRFIIIDYSSIKFLWEKCTVWSFFADLEKGQSLLMNKDCSLSKKPAKQTRAGFFDKIELVIKMRTRQEDKRGEIKIVDIECLMPPQHLLRKIDKVLDWSYVYDLTEKYYCEDNGRPSVDPVVLVKMAFLQHLYGISSLQKQYQK